jgi:hypothetical protein
VFLWPVLDVDLLSLLLLVGFNCGVNCFLKYFLFKNILK